MSVGSPGVWYGAANTGPACSGSPGAERVKVERMILVASCMVLESSVTESNRLMVAGSASSLLPGLCGAREVLPAVRFQLRAGTVCSNHRHKWMP